MSTFVFGAVLCAALLHASWNALVKGGRDTYLTTMLVAVGAAVIAALALPFLRAPAQASWPFIAASAALQLAYYATLVASYRSGDMSHAYPLMRGSAPMLVALASGPLIGEHLAPLQWTGIGCIGAGIVLQSGGAGATRRSTVMALATACLIAAYSLVDGVGVRKSGAPLAYTMWIFLLTGAVMLAWSGLRQGPALARYLQAQPHIAALGGAGTLGAYGIALWAMTQAPVASVAALRETSILFASAVLILHERIGRRRLLATALIVAGAASMRLA